MSLECFGKEVEALGDYTGRGGAQIPWGDSYGTRVEEVCYEVVREGQGAMREARSL